MSFLANFESPSLLSLGPRQNGEVGKGRLWYFNGICWHKETMVLPDLFFKFSENLVLNQSISKQHKIFMTKQPKCGRFVILRYYLGIIYYVKSILFI